MRKKLFQFTANERTGIIVLLIILLVVIVIPKFYRQKEFAPEDLNALKTDFEAFDSVRKVQKTVLQLFTFDPNTADSATFSKLGFSAKQISTIVNFRKSGAIFYNKEDFAKCYAVSDEMYQTLKDYIRIKPFTVELNTADTSKLKQLKGIGPYYAKRIVNYRNRLGGFTSTDQLKEISGIEDRFSEFANNISVDAKHVKKLKINSETEEILKLHPYIGERYAAKICIFRVNKKIESLDEMINNGLIGASASKLSNYLIFD